MADKKEIIKKDFRIEFEILINKYLTGNDHTVLDFILAKYLYSCIQAFDLAIKQIEKTIESVICDVIHRSKSRE